MESGDKYTELKARIRQIFEHHKGRYGYRRITLALKNSDQPANHKTVQRLMRMLNLASLVRPKRYRSYRGPVGTVAPNLLDRQFHAQQLNQKWVTDITQFNVKGQKLYLSPILDLCNGEIVAYQTGRQPVFSLVAGMLRKAFTRLGPSDRPQLHSDQGWQYQHRAYRHLLAEQSITQSMSRKGNCLDNAVIESFFGTLKAEYFYLNRFDSIEQLQKGIDDYIHYYNHERIKLKLKGLSPVQYRAQALSTA